MNYQALAYGFMALTTVMLLLFFWQEKDLRRARKQRNVLQRMFIQMQELDRWFASHPTLLMLPVYVWRHSGASSLYSDPFADLSQQFKDVDAPLNLDQSLTGFREDVVKQLGQLREKWPMALQG